MKRDHMVDNLTGADQKIPDLLVKFTFLGQVETAVKSGIKSMFGLIGFSTSDTILVPWFHFLFNDSPLLIRLLA